METDRFFNSRIYYLYHCFLEDFIFDFQKYYRHHKKSVFAMGDLYLTTDYVV